MTAVDSIALRNTPEGVVLQAKVHPRARHNSVDGSLGGALKLSVTAPADQGKANQAVRELLAETFALPLSAVTIISGQTSSRKAIRLAGISAENVQRRVQLVLGTEEG